MRSKHADLFNHDEDALSYDLDVSNEDDPIRSGYGAVLQWVADVARIGPGSRVLELGSGTGNLTRLLPDCAALVCVDVSQRMEVLAREKVGRFKNRRFIKEDILGVFDQLVGTFDVILSTYTIHHLTDSEKSQLFRLIYRHLADGGRAVFGDLMLESRVLRETTLAKYRAEGAGNAVEGIEEEFFWMLDEACDDLEGVGFQVTTKRFSDLSFGVLCEKKGVSSLQR